MRLLFKGQIAMEFMIFVIMGLLVAVFLVSVNTRIVSNVLDSHSYEEVYSFARSLQEEFFIAAGAGEGYHRRLYLPSSLPSGDYSVSNDFNSITVVSGDYVVVLDVPLINGSLVKGLNVIVNDGKGVRIVH